MIQLLGVHGLPEVAAGDDLAALIADATQLRGGDVLVVAQKVVSKAEGAVATLEPDADVAAVRRALARRLAARVVADTPWALIVETATGLVCANAGVDASNTPIGTLVLLPDDPDASAARLRERLRDVAGVDVGVVVADTFGRPWRLGQTDVAIGVAGVPALRDERGGVDRQGRRLEVTEVAVADELAAAADLVRRKADGVPAVVVRGFAYESDEAATARQLVRPRELDLFPRGRGMLAAAIAEQRWPRRWADGVASADVARLRALAADLQVTTAGPPARLWTGDPVAAGLVVAALVDLGYAARWSRDVDGDGDCVTIHAGVPLSG